MLDLRPLRNLGSDRLYALPLLVLYLTDGCNSRCLSCAIWHAPRRNMPLALALRLAEEAAALGLRHVLLSGGEAMQHPHWAEIAQAFRKRGVHVGLLTNGLLLKKQAEQVIAHIDQLTLSLDAATPELYAHIRGVDALPHILEGMARIAPHVPIITRTTVQRANFRQLSAIVGLAKAYGARKVSFLAVDTVNGEAFGARAAETFQELALTADDLPIFAEVLDALEREHAADFASGLIAESPAKLRTLYAFFASAHGLARFPAPRCNAPQLSVVVETDGRLRPCYFLPSGGSVAEQPLAQALNSSTLRALRRAVRHGERAECGRCVCPLYRGARALLRAAL
ncbi:MAG: radical SAM protein [Chloroflexota bacterium]|nr:MAG: radical SAM protein [Chloroflexota bacterium]